ncbi:caspase family protein [Actinokineospora sp. 24-640]
MARKALLIGAQTLGLKGVANDITAMRTVLGTAGFDCDPREGADATRDGILDAYEQLIGGAGPDDAVVVYYSGHGGYAPDPEVAQGTPSANTHQFLVPTDYTESSDGDMRVVTSFELSLLQARLIERTRNVTVVLDCCHSAHMSRDPDRTPRSLSREVSYQEIRSYVDSMRRSSPDLGLLNVKGNPHAVRLVACAPEQLAYEEPYQGRTMGRFTKALVSALEEAAAVGGTVSWATVLDRVRNLVTEVWAGQRPEAEGPTTRLLFDTVETDPVATFPVTVDRGRARLPGAVLLGVRRGDEFTVMPDDSAEPDSARAVGTVAVESVDAQAAHGAFTPRKPGAVVPLGARAHLTKASLAPVVVHVPDAAEATALVDGVLRSPYLRLAELGERAEIGVGFEADGVVITDEVGPLGVGRTSETVRVLDDLTRIAKARILRRMTGEEGLALPTEPTVEFATVGSGPPVPVPLSGGFIHSGQSILLTVRNPGDHPVYVSLVDIGVSAQIGVLNPYSPSGVYIAPGGQYVFGGNDTTAQVTGLPVRWPESVPTGRPRVETVLVVASDRPTDTNVLTQAGLKVRSGLSHLERCLHQIGSGGSREIVAESARPTRYSVRAVDFTLVPEPAVQDGLAAFQVDTRPRQAEINWADPGDGETRIEVRVSDLLTLHNRASRHTAVRVDTLVVVDDAGVAEARTVWLTDVVDGTRLPLGDLPVFEGTVRDRLDIAVWVSPADQDRCPLADFLRDTEPATTGRWSSSLVDAAEDFLRGVSGETAGLYRTTLLAAERFGVDRPPVETGVRAEDFAFRCTVRESPA